MIDKELQKLRIKKLEQKFYDLEFPEYKLRSPKYERYTNFFWFEMIEISGEIILDLLKKVEKLEAKLK